MDKLPMFLHRLSRLPPWSWLGIVLTVAFSERLGLWLLYAPTPYNDTPSYWRLAQAVGRGFERYDGTRTPGYPLILAIFSSEERVWLAQMGMGILVALFLFYIGWQLSGKAWIGGLAALAHSLNLQQLFFEPNLLSETATTFWIILALVGVVIWFYHPKRRSPWLAAGLGLVVSLAWLTRPLFIYLPFWMLLFLLWGIGSGRNENTAGWKEGPVKTAASIFKPASLIQILAFTLPVVLVFGAWIGFIRERYNQWGLTTMTGYHMIQHTGEFFEYVPDQYAALRDTYLKYRDAHIAQYGTQANTIWEAIPEMQKVSGKSFYDLSRLLARISIQLIREHPDLYLKNVLQGWWLFWLAPVYWSPENLAWPLAIPALRVLILAQRLALIGCNLFFIISSLLAVVWPRLRIAWKLNPVLWHIAGSIWIASVLQTLMDHGDNVRFLVPLQSLVIFWVLWVGISSLTHWSVGHR